VLEKRDCKGGASVWTKEDVYNDLHRFASQVGKASKAKKHQAGRQAVVVQ
jgi:hypothetical protein